MNASQPNAAATLLAALLAPLAMHASDSDVVVTRTARLEGAVSLRGETITVGATRVPWRDVLYLLRPGAAITQSFPTAARTRDGEIVRAELLGVSRKRVRLASPWFGETRLDTAALLCLDFLPGLPAPAHPRPGILERRRADPVPGRLLWAGRDRVTIRSPLGVLRFAPDACRRYVFAEWDAAALTKWVNRDEVGLRDGTLLRGRISPAGPDAVTLDHDRFGRMTLPLHAIRHLARHVPDAPALRGFAPDGVRVTALVQDPRPPVALSGLAAEAAARSAIFVRGIRIYPGTLARIDPPPGGARAGVFRARLLPSADSRGAVRVRFRQGKKELQAWTVTDAPQDVRLRIAAGTALEIETEFGRPMRLPAGVILADPHFVYDTPAPKP